MSGKSDWINAGKPWDLCQPGKAIRDLLGKRYGFTVYAYPDQHHIDAVPPQDHCSFSETGWPIPAPRWWGHAVDVMPLDEKGIPSLAAIARQIIRDKNAGLYPVLKYMNWTDENGDCWNESWQPNHVTTRSTDKGHLHLSFRSDCTHSTTADDYDPVARLLGVDTVTTPQDYWNIDIVPAVGPPDDNGDYGDPKVATAGNKTWSAKYALYAAAQAARETRRLVRAMAVDIGVIKTHLISATEPPPVVVDTDAIAAEITEKVKANVRAWLGTTPAP